MSIMTPRERDALILRLIGLAKVGKAATLAVVGFGLHRLLRGDVQETLLHWARAVRVDVSRPAIQDLITRATGLSQHTLGELSVVTFIYAALFGTEGVGLLLRQRWAEYVTIISTAGLLPLEVYEIVHRISVAKVVLLVINVLIVWYLVAQLWKRRNTETN
jgi:uncharacterized membrane protein (DUF2068 family)